MPQTSTAQERRTLSLHHIKALLSVRNEMLALYGQLATKTPFEKHPSAKKLLQTFCAALVDYTADAHFELYRYLDENKERRQSVLRVADNTYPRICEITQQILDFNDKYDCEAHCDLKALANDLSRIGELLADRAGLEDQLIHAMIDR